MTRMATESRPPRRLDRTRRTVTAGAFGLFVAALLTAGAIFLFTPDPATPHQQAPAGPTAPADPGDSVCGLPAGDQTVPTTTPPVTSWALIGTMAAPISRTVGPGAAGGGLPYCYAHSPLGALYAASIWLAVNTDPAARLDAARYLTAAGPGRDELLHQLAGGVGGPSSPDLQLAGFIVAPNYDPNAATVDLALRLRTSYLHIPVALRWEAGDWKAVVPDDGHPLEQIAALPDLSTYVPWSGR